jgi:hypothetical protein
MVVFSDFIIDQIVNSIDMVKKYLMQILVLVMVYNTA